MKKSRRMREARECWLCGEEYFPNNPRQKYCAECSPNITQLDAVYPRLKAAADASGNPKIWTAEQYDQNFLKTLIPLK